ncbi:MAG: hypothetical protein RMM28_05440 [Thermoleophilia bacterium]|nr:hypothetical protein [Gaiellaceae bacterium]MDW8338564.1 hypothetical protein [Thermoleophilia bacterium]
MSRLRPLLKERRLWTWGLVAQVSSSASSVALTVAGGRLLGPSGLGVIVAGFAAYLVALNVHRALVVTPLVATSSAASFDVRVHETRAALSVTIVVAGAGSVALAAGGLAVGGTLGEGMLAFAPWLAPALAHDLAKSALFRDGRGRLAAASEVLWLSIFVCVLVLASPSPGSATVVAAWGCGAVAAAGVTLLPTGYLRASRGWRWFRGRAFALGRWLVVQEGAYQGGSYALVAALTLILGSSGVGGLRAAETVFAPFSLLSRAAALPGLPAVSRALARSHDEAVRLAAAISLGVVSLTFAYVVVMLVQGTALLALVFGGEFGGFGTLVVPLSAWQLALAAAVGFGLLLTAQRRGGALLACSIVGIGTTVGASSILASLAGVEGAAWGFALGAAVAATLTIGLALRPTGVLPQSQSELGERVPTTTTV